MPNIDPIQPTQQERIVAVGFLTEHDLGVLGQGFRRAYRLEKEHDFQDLLAAIDRADQRKD
ncbi:MAG: hypothetical protein DI605_18385 [Sphingomonas sp.]|nr:MAG: hypothetical protein DI605_18385 [Sphingomonas sp.]